MQFWSGFAKNVKCKKIEIYVITHVTCRKNLKEKSIVLKAVINTQTAAECA